MLNCEYCDYLKNTKEAAGKVGEEHCLYCSFSGYIFTIEDMNKDMEYPCKDLSYEEYLNKKRRTVAAKVKGENWKVQYKNHTTAPDKKKYPVAV